MKSDSHYSSFSPIWNVQILFVFQAKNLFVWTKWHSIYKSVWWSAYLLVVSQCLLNMILNGRSKRHDSWVPVPLNDWIELSSLVPLMKESLLLSKESRKCWKFFLHLIVEPRLRKSIWELWHFEEYTAIYFILLLIKW